MPTFDRYLLREFSQAIFAALVVLMGVILVVGPGALRHLRSG